MSSELLSSSSMQCPHCGKDVHQGSHHDATKDHSQQFSKMLAEGWWKPEIASNDPNYVTSTKDDQLKVLQHGRRKSLPVENEEPVESEDMNLSSYNPMGTRHEENEPVLRNRHRNLPPSHENWHQLTETRHRQGQQVEMSPERTEYLTPQQITYAKDDWRYPREENYYLASRENGFDTDIAKEQSRGRDAMRHQLAHSFEHERHSERQPVHLKSGSNNLSKSTNFSVPSASINRRGLPKKPHEFSKSRDEDFGKDTSAKEHYQTDHVFNDPGRNPHQTGF
jgi:glucan-binding YG repeat protein